MNHPFQLPGDRDRGWCTEESTNTIIPICICSWFPCGADYRQNQYVFCVNLNGRPSLQSVPPKGGSSACPRVSLYGTSGINEHMFPSDNQGLTLSVDFYCITKCSCNPGSIFFSSFPSSHLVPLLVSPCLSCQSAPPERVSLSTFPLHHFTLPSAPSPPLRHRLNKSLQSDDCGWRDARTERRRCDYCNLLFRMSVLAET